MIIDNKMLFFFVFGFLASPSVVSGNLALGIGPLSFSINSCGCCGGCGLPFLPSNAGPLPLPSPILPAPSITLPAVAPPIIELPPPPVPPTQVIDNKCICKKTVVKPQLYQRYINVPSVNRFIKNSYAPVVEDIPYVANACGGCRNPLDAAGLPFPGGFSLPGTSGFSVPGSCFGGFPF